MSDCTIWPTFSSTLIRLRMLSIRASIFGSLATALLTDGQWTGAGAETAAPASNRASTPAGPNFRIFPPPNPLDATLGDNAIIRQDAAREGGRNADFSRDLCH